MRRRTVSNEAAQTARLAGSASEATRHSHAAAYRLGETLLQTWLNAPKFEPSSSLVSLGRYWHLAVAEHRDAFMPPFPNFLRGRLTV